ncbi:MAG: hypothetical protein ACK4NW_08535 [Roseinatronobacter sp.]
MADDISEAFFLPELFDIMATEGRNSVVADGATPLQGSALVQFEQDVHMIYAPDRMLTAFVGTLDAELADKPDVRADALAFAATELGQRILRLEIAARQALIDDDVDYVARDVLSEARSAGADARLGQRLEQVRARIDANELLELNVSLGLNTSYAYYRGMMSEDAVFGLSGELLLQLVWEQEPSIRADIEDWIESYFLMAYQPLEPAEMDAFVSYVATPLAQDFNRAMFRAFDTVFSEISFQVGKALGRRLRAEEL